MAISPFSSNELGYLKEIFESNGFKVKGTIENYFRYSISTKEKIIVFTLKLPVKLPEQFPLKLNFPFEVISFKVSLVINLWNLSEKTYKILIYLMKALKQISTKASIEHNFPLEGLEKNLGILLNHVIPDVIKDENESAWINRIRVSLLSKRDHFKDLENKNIEKVVETLKKSGLNPTFKKPLEIEKGIPKLRISEILLFSNEESEFFILEKGFFTYFKDIEYKKFYIRSLFESYSPFILENLFSNLNFNIEIYLENWIKFSRLILNALIEIIDSSKIESGELIEFKQKKLLEIKDFEENQNNFPFSAICYESSMPKDLYSLNTELLSTPATHFEVMESLYCLSEANELISSYKFKEASKILENALKMYNKYRQKKIIVLILLQLRKIASTLNQDSLAINHLQTALEISKSGEVPVEYILSIQYQLGKIYYKLGDFTNSLNYFKVLIQFIENEKGSIEKDNYLGMAFLYMGLIYQELNDIANSKVNFRNAFHIGSTKSQKVLLKYHLLRAKQYKKKGNLSQTHILLKKAFESLKDVNEESESVLIDLFLELAEFYVHHRKDTKKAFYCLNTIKSYLSKKNLSGIKKTLRWNLLMSDYYKFLVKSEEYKAFFTQSENLRNQLRAIGISE